MVEAKSTETQTETLQFSTKKEFEAAGSAVAEIINDLLEDPNLVLPIFDDEATLYWNDIQVTTPTIDQDQGDSSIRVLSHKRSMIIKGKGLLFGGQPLNEIVTDYIHPHTNALYDYTGERKIEDLRGKGRKRNGIVVPIQDPEPWNDQVEMSLLLDVKTLEENAFGVNKGELTFGIEIIDSDGVIRQKLPRYRKHKIEYGSRLYEQRLAGEQEVVPSLLEMVLVNKYLETEYSRFRAFVAQEFFRRAMQEGRVPLNQEFIEELAIDYSMVNTSPEVKKHLYPKLIQSVIPYDIVTGRKIIGVMPEKADKYYQILQNHKDKQSYKISSNPDQKNNSKTYEMSANPDQSLDPDSLGETPFELAIKALHLEKPKIGHPHISDFSQGQWHMRYKDVSSYDPPVISFRFWK